LESNTLTCIQDLGKHLRIKRVTYIHKDKVIKTEDKLQYTDDEGPNPYWYLIKIIDEVKTIDDKEAKEMLN
jgi:hypothetical protein